MSGDGYTILPDARRGESIPCEVDAPHQPHINAVTRDGGPILCPGLGGTEAGTEAVTVPIELVRAATQALRAASGRSAAAAGQRLAEILREHDAPDLFVAPGRDVIEVQLPPMDAP